MSEARRRRANDRPLHPGGRCVLYWMQRSQRGEANAALERAVELANTLKRPVVVYFGLDAAFPMANLRSFQFMLEGLAETARALEARGLPFVLRREPPGEGVIRLARELDAAAVVGDENPLRVPRAWRERAARELSVACEFVDADVVVPQSHWPRAEWSAATLRRKLLPLLPSYLRPLAASHQGPAPWRGPTIPGAAGFDAAALLRELPIDRSVAPSGRFTPGRAAGLRALHRFLAEGLPRYHTDRSRPESGANSGLSPYLHFGQVGPLEVALAVRDSGAPAAAIAAFLEELIVRRELAINYVTHTPEYDRLAGAPEWGRRTLARHAADPRPALYSRQELDAAATDDPLWNAAQREMVATGYMHGYLRMLWAKKILEWSRDPEEAFETAVWLNDRYELDGRDPNGYAGIAWSIGGRHDRPWGPERPVFGTVRPMTHQGARRKFDVDAYIRRWGEAG